MAKDPAILFYPADWLMDAVSGCSIAAQGLWWRMLILMHGSERRGYLLLNGRPMPDSFIANKVGLDLQTYRSLLQELDDAAVPSRTPEGTIYNRRMVRDTESRAKNAARQAKMRANGGGDPNRWYEIRKRILRRDRNTCAYCGCAATTVDHVLPKTQGGTEDDWNLVAACKACNMRKTNRTPEQAGMAFDPEFNKSVLVTERVTASVTPLSVNDNETANEVEVKELKYEFSVENFDGEKWVRRIQKIWPKCEFNYIEESSVLQAIEDEIKADPKKKRVEAAEYLCQEVERCARVVNQWPERENKFVPTLNTVMFKHQYRWADKLWERKDGKKSLTDF